jgi:Lrp/AsnC family leucine-responsive transcriptional regulator
VPEHDVEREQRRVDRGQPDAPRFGDQAHVGEQVHAADGQHERGAVAQRARRDGGEHDHRQELDGGDGAQRQPVDRQVEAAVHHREDGSPGDDQHLRPPVDARPDAPGPAPDREDERRRGDPQPGDAQRIDPDEQQHGERRPEVVEHRAHDEPQVRRHALCHHLYARQRGAAKPCTCEGRRRLSMTDREARTLLDDVNRSLLSLLAEDPRLSVSALARRVGMSAPAVRERLARLEESGVIRGYRLDVDPAAVGLPVAAWVRIRPGPGQLTRIAELAARRPEISECHRISGEDCFLLQVHVAEIAALEGVLDEFLLYGQTISSFVVSTPVPPRPVLPAVPSTARSRR